LKLFAEEEKEIKIGLKKQDVIKAFAMSKMIVIQEKS
jgi:hypothetical protein